MTEPSAPSAPSSVVPTGRVAEERKNGYTQMATQDGEAPKKPKEYASAREAGDALDGKRRRSGNVEKPVEEIKYKNADGSTADERQTISIERGADDLAQMRKANSGMAEALAADDVADKVDALRTKNADVIAAGSATEPNQPQLEQPAADPAAQQFERDAVAAGVDPALARVLQHPQARKALEAEFGKVAALQQDNSNKIQLAQFFAREAWLSGFSDLAKFPLDRIAPELVRLHQTNPQRAKAAMASLQRVGDMAAWAENHAAQAAHAERQQFAREAQIQDAQFEKMVGPRSPQQRAAVGTETAAYAAELGIPLPTLVHLLQTNPIMRHSAFQKMMYDAVTSRMNAREAAKYRDKIDRTLPPVNRPGTTGPRTSRGNANLAELAQKANSNPSLKSMAALLAAKRRS